MLQLFYTNFLSNGYFLDIGCGSGNDVIFMSKQCFKVDAIDISQDKIKILKTKIIQENISNVNILQLGIEDFNIRKNKYDIIQAYNVFQFIPKEKTLLIIENIKNNIKQHGFIIVSVFTIDDPMYKKNNTSDMTFFNKQELLSIFNTFEILYYFENVIIDNGHIDYPYKHKHGIARIVIKKK